MVIVILLICICGWSLLLAWPFMWIWNYAVVAAITVAKPITYWVAFWLMVFLATVRGTATESKAS